MNRLYPWRYIWIYRLSFFSHFSIELNCSNRLSNLIFTIFSRQEIMIRLNLTSYTYYLALLRSWPLMGIFLMTKKSIHVCSPPSLRSQTQKKPPFSMVSCAF